MTKSPHYPTDGSDGLHESQAESETYKDTSQNSGRSPSKLKITLIAAAGALAGGLAAAWYYRRTVSKLQTPPENPEDSNFGIYLTDGDLLHGEDFDPEI